MNANKYSLDTNEQNADYEQKHSAKIAVDAHICLCCLESSSAILLG